MKNLLNSDIVGINGDDGKTKFFNDNVISTIAKGPRKGVRPRQVFVVDAMQFPISESTRVRCLKGDNCIKKTKKTWIGQKQQISVVLLQYIWDFGRGGGGQLLRVGLGLGGYFGTKRTRAGVLCEVIIRLLIPST